MTEEEIHEITRTIIKRFDDIKIVGQGWSGSSREGFLFNPQSSRTSSGGGGVTPETGACCFPDGTCLITTLGQCAIDGGTYQGDGTVCVPNPCPAPSSCSTGATVTYSVHATGSGSGCPTMNITDSLTEVLPAGDGFLDFTGTLHPCIAGCSPSETYTGAASYSGFMICEEGSFSLFTDGVSVCCGLISDNIGCDPHSVFNCTCSSASGSSFSVITAPGVYTFHFSGTTGGLTWTLDVIITVTFP